MLRAKGAAGYAGFNSQGSELPRTNGRGGSGTYAGGGGRKGAAARRRRLLSRLGIVVAAAMVLYLLARSRSSGGGGRGAGGKGGGGASEIREVQKSTQVHNLNIEETAKAAEASAQAILRDHPSAFGAAADALDGGLDARDSWVERLSWSPRATLHHAFLTRAECDHLISLAKPHMEPSTVVDNVSGERQPSKVRTSSGMFLERGVDEVVSRIEEKIAAASGVPVSHGEGLQVLAYKESELYEPHYDYFHEQVNQANGGQRIATMLMYLSDVEEGGETVFDAASDLPTKPPADPAGLSECARKKNNASSTTPSSLAVRPRKGDALLFWSLKPDGSLDHSSLHGGCPVIKGEKWSATKWMRVREYSV